MMLPISNVPVKFTVPLCVKPPLLRGMVPPVVPVLTAAAVPAPTTEASGRSVALPRSRAEGVPPAPL